LRRTSFREGGRPHQLLVLADLSQPLREEERAAWQRLIRVLGHELNNSLAPIHSIADSLVMLLCRPVTQRSGDWEQDIEGGLEVIASRAEALSRFMGGYSKLARLPAPVIRDCEIEPLIRHAAAFEVRLPVTIHPGIPIILPLDSDQMSQSLINLIRNGADAALETGSSVDVGWKVEEAFVEIYVDDGGHGLTNTTNLFVPFFTTKPRGSGIGLVLSRQIIEAHAGSLVLMNRPDGKEGCRAVVRLPLAEGSNGIERDRARSSGIERTPAVPILPDPSPRGRS
jgi:nitrogen fixation/metabolism regulation signal transduction histidine kinase